MEEDIKKRVDEGWKEKAKEEPVHENKQQEEAPEVNLKFFVSSLAMQAWIALGAMANPLSGNTETNLAQAQFLIDSLEMLKEKTKGNCDKEETEMFEQILYELHMAFAAKINEEETKKDKSL